MLSTVGLFGNSVCRYYWNTETAVSDFNRSAYVRYDCTAKCQCSFGVTDVCMLIAFDNKYIYQILKHVSFLNLLE